MSNSALLNKKIIARIDRAGVFHGILDYKDAEITRMRQVRRIYRWNGALSVTDIAANGITDGKITAPADVVEFETRNVIELILADKKASANIESIKPWHC